MCKKATLLIGTINSPIECFINTVTLELDVLLLLLLRLSPQTGDILNGWPVHLVNSCLTADHL